MYIFWKYDQYPYLLGDKVDDCVPSIKRNNIEYFCTINYQEYFSPSFSLPDKEGKELLSKLFKLKSEFLEEKDKLRNKYSKLALSSIQEYILL